MFTYQLRPRIFRHDPGEGLHLPAHCIVRFHFLPSQPFGAAADGGRTAVRAEPANARFNANTGAHTIRSEKPLTPLDVTIEEPSRLVQVDGRTLALSQNFDSLRELDETIKSIFFGMPILLNLGFADPPYIERVDGTVGSSSFRWELSCWQMRFQTTTQERQEASVAKAWERMGVLAGPHRRRLIAGLHHFHLACRLAREAETAGEFVAEVVLNLCKALEVVFPPEEDGRSRDAARAGLRRLGFSDDRIEGDFLPAMALRNQIDVGHVQLGLFKVDQLKIIHAFAERAEDAFRDMFDRLLSAIEGKQWDVPVYTIDAPRREATELIERLRKHTPDWAI